MKKTIAILAIYFVLDTFLIHAQVNLTIEGTVVNNTTQGDWSGVNIQRSSPTKLIYRNNSITSVNASGYMLQAGDETETATNNNLDGEIISGNKLVWNGSDA